MSEQGFPEVIMRRGTVLDTEKRIESKEISGYMQNSLRPGASTFDRKRISLETKNILHHHFWVQLENGVEEPINLTSDTAGNELPLRTGQKIALVYIKHPDEEQKLVAVVNYNAKSVTFLKTGTELLSGVLKHIQWDFSFVMKLILYPWGIWCGMKFLEKRTQQGKDVEKRLQTLLEKDLEQ